MYPSYCLCSGVSALEKCATISDGTRPLDLSKTKLNYKVQDLCKFLYLRIMQIK